MTLTYLLTYLDQLQVNELESRQPS